MNRRLPPWMPVIQDSYHKSDDLYEAEQHAMISYFETCEYFLERLRQEIDRFSVIAMTIWMRTHPVQEQYRQAIADRDELQAHVLSMVQAQPRYKDFICPVTMPIITSMVRGDA
jgi:hypothetical protein